MGNYVAKYSIVREIWGSSDTILLIFAGASAEFALNKAVDWLYFTGRLPKDPLGRLFSTVSYARKIVFSDEASALTAIEKINAVHASVENNRGKKIPDWAYKDVLFMLIDYTIRAYEFQERPLTHSEKQEVVSVFTKVGKDMGLSHLPKTYTHFETMRQMYLKQDLFYGAYTKDLYKQYHKHLGTIRYRLLLEAQKALLPNPVRELLHLKKMSWLPPLYSIYKWSSYIKMDALLRAFILPAAYKENFRLLNTVSR